MMEPQLFIGSEPKEQLLSKIENLNEPALVKPKGGLWTSTYHKDYGSEWFLASLAMGIFDNEKSFWLLTPKEDSKVLTIDSGSDLNQLYELYSKPCESIPSMQIIDFEMLASMYDGLHLTKKGQKETRLSFPHHTYSWDCESTIWFRWVFDKVEQITLTFGKEGAK